MSVDIRVSIDWWKNKLFSVYKLLMLRCVVAYNYSKGMCRQKHCLLTINDPWLGAYPTSMLQLRFQ